MTGTNTPRNPLDRIESQQEANTKAITDINQALNIFVTGILRLMSTVMVENQKKASANEQRFKNLLGKARADREENRRRFNAQQQISQSRLIELAKLNLRLEILETTM